MISVDGSLIIQIINFVFLIWVLNIVLYRPIRKVLLQRKGKVSDLEGALTQCDAEVQEKDEAYNRGMRTARAEGMKEKEAYLDDAAAEERKIIEQINQKAQAELTAVRDKIAKDTEAVRQALMKDVDTFADAISQKILGRAVR